MKADVTPLICREAYVMRRHGGEIVVADIECLSSGRMVCSVMAIVIVMVVNPDGRVTHTPAVGATFSERILSTKRP
jgi:hypothetical protein